jgi:hypothetical protein
MKTKRLTSSSSGSGDSSLTPPLLKIGELGLDPTLFLLDPGVGLVVEDDP